ncbi:FCS-Like Zinc finger 6-like [Miscanthus floridulus]|uniref:FCS-Like Zinc finger 6-like n=1 Tax=Miscanthus floridulus TaxID=154761 RepID=UPI003457A8B0
MSTRKRPRNNNGSTSTPSSAGRSSGGGSTLSSSSSSAMRRTTSLSDLAPPPEIPGRPQTRAARGDAVVAGAGTVWGGAEMMRRHSGDFLPAMETAAFLKACGLCKRRLGPGRDTFIYMGEVAFCSQECRQQQMNLDELMENKCSTPAGGGGSGGGSSDQSGKSSTVAAA